MQLGTFVLNKYDCTFLLTKAILNIKVIVRLFINKFSQYKSNCIQIEKDVLISDLYPLLKYLIITQYVTNIMSQVKTIFDKSGARSSSTSSPRVGCMLLSSGTDPDTALLMGVFLKAGWDLLLIMA